MHCSLRNKQETVKRQTEYSQEAGRIQTSTLQARGRQDTYMRQAEYRQEVGRIQSRGRQNAGKRQAGYKQDKIGYNAASLRGRI